MTAERRVLVCDDEVQILRALRIILRDAGFEVITAATAQEALDAASLKGPHAAILDLTPPRALSPAACSSARRVDAVGQ